MIQKSVSDPLPNKSVLGVFVHISVLEESVHDIQCVVGTQLHQEPSVVIYVSITMLTNHALPHPGIVPNACIKVSRRILDSFTIIVRRASLLSFSHTNSGHGAFECGLYSCINYRERSINFSLNMHTLS